jgi:hypothetical protein
LYNRYELYTIATYRHKNLIVNRKYTIETCHHQTPIVNRKYAVKGSIVNRKYTIETFRHQTPTVNIRSEYGVNGSIVNQKSNPKRHILIPTHRTQLPTTTSYYYILFSIYFIDSWRSKSGSRQFIFP